MKILVIEDEKDIQTLVKIALEFTGDHQVTIADNGAMGLEVVESAKPDLILLDVMMPKLDGFETLRRLRANIGTQSTPVIFLTAKAQKKEITQGLELGAIGYITKPFDAMQLNQQIEELLANSERSPLSRG